jgi:hypothetical protein
MRMYTRRMLTRFGSCDGKSTLQVTGRILIFGAYRSVTCYPNLTFIKFLKNRLKYKTWLKVVTYNGLLRSIIWTSSIVLMFCNHNVSRDGSSLVIRRNLLCWVRSIELVSVGEPLWLQNIRTMDKVQTIDHSNTVPSSKTFRNEVWWILLTHLLYEAFFGVLNIWRWDQLSAQGICSSRYITTLHQLSRLLKDDYYEWLFKYILKIILYLTS